MRLVLKEEWGLGGDESIMSSTQAFHMSVEALLILYIFIIKELYNL